MPTGQAKEPDPEQHLEGTHQEPVDQGVAVAPSPVVAQPEIGETPMAQAEEADQVPSTVELNSGQLQEAQTSATSVGHPDTIPLSETEAPPIPPLAEKDVLDDRYRVAAVLGTVRGTNIYRVQDLQGYRRCWACGSTASVEGETYCVDCGAQLTGRNYRLQEFNMPPVDGDAEQGDIAVALAPLPILENATPGVAHVYDFLVDRQRDRAYIVWEEIYGRPLSAWIADASEASTLVALAPPSSSGHLPSMEEPEDGQAVYWMSQAAGILSALHEHGIAGCNIGLDNLVVQAGDRVALIDPSGCRMVNDAEKAAAVKADVRALAAALEGWYVAVHEDDMPAQGATGQNNGLVPGASDVTGPLSGPPNAAAVLSRARAGAYPTAEDLAEELLKIYEASKPLNNLILWSGRASNLGRVRQVNEDSVLTLEATALEHAIRTIGAVVNSSLITPLVAGDPVSTNPASLGALLQNAVIEANRRIHELAQERHSDLGTTVTVALVVGSQLTVANVGDSRTYLARDGQLAVITRDHSLVAQLVSSGQLAPEDLYTHPRRNEIYRALGDPHLTSAEVDTFSHRLQPGDGVLLCSDGLWDFVRDPVINAIITGPEGQNPQSTCQALIDRANAMGGEDNISTIFVRMLQLPED